MPRSEKQQINTQERYKKIADLLLNSSLTCAEIGQMCGVTRQVVDRARRQHKISKKKRGGYRVIEE